MFHYLSGELRNLGLSLLLGAGIAGCDAKERSVTVEPVERWFNNYGQVRTINRLKVEWYNNEKCGDSFGRSPVVENNVYSILKGYPDRYYRGSDSLSIQFPHYYMQKFELDEKTRKYIDGYSGIWRTEKWPFVRESDEDEATLREIGWKIYDDACNDIEKGNSGD